MQACPDSWACQNNHDMVIFRTKARHALSLWLFPLSAPLPSLALAFLFPLQRG
jgi:hypothetical protein